MERNHPKLLQFNKSIYTFNKIKQSKYNKILYFLNLNIVRTIYFSIHLDFKINEKLMIILILKKRND